MNLFLTSLLLFLPTVFCKDHYIYWNTTSMMWKTENDPEITVRIGDKIRIVCPDETAHENSKYLIVNQVSEMAYLQCTLETNKKQIHLCTKDVRRSGLINVNNRPAAHGSSFEFIPGNTYYWISTSGGTVNTMERTTRGLCVSDNMRLRINVEEALPARTTTHPPLPAQAASIHPNNRIHPKGAIYAGRIPATLDQKYVLEVAKLANEGKTGTFPREDNNREVLLGTGDFPLPIITPAELKNKATSGAYAWQPVPAETYTDILSDAKHLIYDSLKQAEENIEFVVHEEEGSSIHARSYPLESSSSAFQFIFITLFLNFLLL